MRFWQGTATLLGALALAFAAHADSTGIGKGSPTAAPPPMDKELRSATIPVDMTGTGKVKFVAANKSSFKCWWDKKLHAFAITRTTKFQKGNATASVADLKVGETVAVQYRAVGTSMVADLVVISP
jgi:hypothetical protein